MNLLQKKSQANEKQNQVPVIYWLLSLSHYMFGLASIGFTILVANSPNGSYQKMMCVITIISILLFALTEPDVKYKQMEYWKGITSKSKQGILASIFQFFL